MSKASELANLIGNINAGGGGVNRNCVINGDMSVSQRTTSVASITGAGYHFIDRYRLGGTVPGTWTLSQSTDVPSGQGFGNSMKLDCTASASQSTGDMMVIQHKMEGQNLQGFAKGTSDAKPFALSFWVKSNKTGTYIVSLLDNDNTRHISKSYTISSANTWEHKKLTFDADTTGAFGNDNGASLEIYMWLSAGNDFASGTLATSWASVTNANYANGQVNLCDSTDNDWYLTGLQLEVGQNPTEFEHETFDLTLRKCERYFQKSYIHSEVAGGSTNGGTGTYKGNCLVQSMYNTTYNQQMYNQQEFRTKMRDAPTIVYYNPYNGDSGKMMHNASGTSITVSSSYQSENGFRITGSGLSSTGDNNGGDTYAFHFTADDEL